MLKIFLMGLLLFVIACSPMHVMHEEDLGEILQDLRNAEYPIDITKSGKARLKDGYFEETIAPDTATKTKIWLGKERVLGDLDGDKMQDAAVTLIVDSGGSGLFTYLSAIISRDEKSKPLDSVLIGDRIIVKSLLIKKREVLIEFLTRKTDEPMTVKPCVKVTKRFTVRDGRLVEKEESD